MPMNDRTNSKCGFMTRSLAWILIIPKQKRKKKSYEKLFNSQRAALPFKVETRFNLEPTSDLASKRERETSRLHIYVFLFLQFCVLRKKERLTMASKSSQKEKRKKSTKNSKLCRAAGKEMFKRTVIESMGIEVLKANHSCHKSELSNSPKISSQTHLWCDKSSHEIVQRVRALTRVASSYLQIYRRFVANVSLHSTRLIARWFVAFSQLLCVLYFFVYIFFRV